MLGFGIRGGILANWAADFGFTGAQLGAIGGALFMAQLTGRKEVQFDLRKFHWIGSASQDSIIFYMRADTPFKTMILRMVGMKIMTPMIGLSPSGELLARVRAGQVGGVILFGDWGAKFYFNAMIAAAVAVYFLGQLARGI